MNEYKMTTSNTYGKIVNQIKGTAQRLQSNVKALDSISENNEGANEGANEEVVAGQDTGTSGGRRRHRTRRRHRQSRRQKSRRSRRQKQSRRRR